MDVFWLILVMAACHGLMMLMMSGMHKKNEHGHSHTPSEEKAEMERLKVENEELKQELQATKFHLNHPN